MTCKGCKRPRGVGWGIRRTLPDGAGGIERSLAMQHKHTALRSVLIAFLLPGIVVGMTGPPKPAPADQTLKAIEDCMAGSPAPWPDEWKQEYIDTIRNAVELHQGTLHYAVRLEILRKGFAPCKDLLTT